MRKIVLILTCMFLYFGAMSQDYTFRVLANKGDNRVINGTGKELPLKTGSKLVSTDKLVVSEGSYIGLMHNCGKTIEVRSSGKVSVYDLEKKVKVENTSVATRYARYVSNRMNETENTNYRTRLSATGAVSRKIGANEINVYAPESSKILAKKEFLLKWDEYAAGSKYIVTVTNLFNEVVYNVSTTDNKIYIPIENESIKSTGFIKVQVSLDGNESVKSEDKGIKLVNDYNVISEYNTLVENLDNTSVSKLVFATFYEENELYIDAVSAYEELIEDEPEVEDFQDLYNSFLITNGFK